MSRFSGGESRSLEQRSDLTTLYSRDIVADSARSNHPLYWRILLVSTHFRFRCEPFRIPAITTTTLLLISSVRPRASRVRPLLLVYESPLRVGS
jgi:hypothetical protein